MSPKAGAAALAIAAAALVATTGPAFAHGVVGKRFFPATLVIDDPAVADELSLPTVAGFRNADGERETDLSAEWSKRITPDFGVSLGGAWTRLPVEHGFQNLETSLKYQLLTNAPREAIVSVGLEIEWGGTGSASVGAEDATTLAPTLFFGKGLGDLPDRFEWVRPFAITGQLAYEIPAHAHSGDEANPYLVTYGFALEYSLPYLHAHVRDDGWPTWVNHLTPVIEMSFETPVRQGGGEPTTGTISPGVIWTGRRFQLGAEALIPINGTTARTGGFVVQAHFYLDDIFPRSIGRPIFPGGRR